jgi:aminoglycoside/choline kinase family phosphotransferase
VWHVYDDLGSWELDACEPQRERVKTAVELIAQIHTRFARHPFLGEVRMQGGDLGIQFFESNVRDALYALQGWQPSAEQGPLRGRLLERLDTLRHELPQRAEALAELGGPETLLHGDLWTTNTFVLPGPNGLRARLIDWDHAAVGPFSYDLSTFLLRFSHEHRPWILDAYRTAMAPAGWRLPGSKDLNLLFETAEYARFANSIIWPAIALLRERAQWALPALAEVAQWFEAWQPVFPDDRMAHRQHLVGG